MNVSYSNVSIVFRKFKKIGPLHNLYKVPDEKTVTNERKCHKCNEYRKSVDAESIYKSP